MTDKQHAAKLRKLAWQLNEAAKKAVKEGGLEVCFDTTGEDFGEVPTVMVDVRRDL